MFTPTNCHSASFDAMRTAFRHAAEAEARQQASATPAVIDAPRRNLLTAVLALANTLTGAAIGLKGQPAVDAASAPSPSPVPLQA